MTISSPSLKNKWYRNEHLYLVLFWSVYLFLCIYFYVARSTYADNGYYVFNIIQKENFNLEHLRFGGICTQWMAVLAVQLHLPLKYVMLAFSINPWFWYLLIFLGIRYLSNEKWISYCLLLAMTGTLHHAFYFINSELAEGCGLLILLVAVLRSDKLKSAKRLGLIVMILCFMLFLHLFLLLISLMLVVLHYAQYREKKDLPAGIFALLFLFLKMFFVKDGYENSVLGHIDIKFLTLKNLYASYFPEFLFHNILYFYLPAILLLFVFFFYTRTSLLYKLILISGIAGIYLLLVLYLKGGSFHAYSDLYSSVLFYFIWASLAIIITTDQIREKYFIPLMAFVVFFSFTRLFKEKEYAVRERYLLTEMEQKPNKQIIPLECVPIDFSFSGWSVPYESLLMSSSAGTSKTILLDDHYDIHSYLSDSTLFLGASWAFGAQTRLNERYFRLRNSLYVRRR